MKVGPLPPIAQDPSIVRGQQIKAAFTPSIQNVRKNRSLDQLAVAEEITRIWETSNAELAKLYTDLQNRRQARIQVLETLVPLGPAIPAGASAADTALLQQTFRAALAEARDAAAKSTSENVTIANQTTPGLPSLRPTATSLQAMLADAEKFNDDNLRRAVLTAAWEAGEMSIVRAWTDQMGVTGKLDEFGELLAAVEGRGLAGSWNFTALSQIPAPSEVSQLDNLRKRAGDANERRALGFV